MAYTLLFQKTDTIATGSSLLSGATSTTLTGGNFGSPTGTQLYVVDYDVPAKAEIITATVIGTAVTSIVRGLTGGAAGTTDHAAGANVISSFVPQHYGNGLGAIAAADPWTAWTPTITGFSAGPGVSAAYMKLGSFLFLEFTTTSNGTSNATNFTITNLPFAPKRVATATLAQATDNGSIRTVAGRVVIQAASTTATLFTDMGVGTWTGSGSKSADFRIFYEV